MDDPIVCEVRKAGEDIARQANYDTCAICGRNELIKYKTRYGRLVCIHCAEDPSHPIMEKAGIYGLR